MAKTIFLGMKLKAYLQKSNTTQLQLAQALGVSQPTVADWLANRRPVPQKRALEIEEWSDGSVTAVELRPRDAVLAELRAARST